jgi:uncharacterized repeat protein (TIGR04138 family)
MSFFNPKLAEVVKRDPRYSYEAYEFLQQALSHTLQQLGREPVPDTSDADAAAEPKNHVSGPELLEGVRSLALREFGLMARTVFHMWGIRKTADFGEMVFNLVEGKLMSKAADDRREDFCDVFDLDEALVRNYRIPLDDGR